MEGFGHLTNEAIASYFRHYLIRSGDAELPLELLQHPLTLRIFCEVINPERKQLVVLPPAQFTSTGLLDKYVEQTTTRIAQLSKPTHRYYAHDVRGALDKMGIALWEHRQRALPYGDLKTLLNESSLPWDKSLIRLLEQEGIVIKFPRRIKGNVDTSDNHVQYSITYDALAGHFIAGAILTREGGNGFHIWLNNQKTLVRRLAVTTSATLWQTTSSGHLYTSPKATLPTTTRGVANR